MSRKKLSEMTPIERVDQRMKGMTWEEAEDVGVEILARCMALHTYARKDGEEFFKNVMERICKRGDEWAKTHTAILAFASLGYKEQQEKEKEKEKNNETTV